MSHDQIPEIALKWANDGRQVALATVISTWGSAPRPVGAQLVIDESGSFEGSVSGGCVEGAVIVEAQSAILTGKCRVLSFSVSDENAFETGLTCGGEIEVMVEPLGRGNGPSITELASLVAARRDRVAAVWEVNLENWSRHLHKHPSETELFASQTRTGNSYRDGDRFFGVHSPPLRLAIVGAVHIAQPLTEMARLAGYDVALCDPRESFATQERFPDAVFLDGWPDQALNEFKPDFRTAVVTLSHDPKIDTPALLAALDSDAFYIGALGSSRTHAKRVSELQKAGVSDDQIVRVSGPVGLDIGAKSPAEIAVSIMAEMTEQLRGR